VEIVLVTWWVLAQKAPATASTSTTTSRPKGTGHRQHLNHHLSPKRHRPPPAPQPPPLAQKAPAAASTSTAALVVREAGHVPPGGGVWGIARRQCWSETTGRRPARSARRQPESIQGAPPLHHSTTPTPHSPIAPQRSVCLSFHSWRLTHPRLISRPPPEEPAEMDEMIAPLKAKPFRPFQS
jgi:hypothetical protein